MGKKLSAWWSARRPTRRRLVQLYAALLYNAHLKGFIEGEIYTGPVKNLCVPGLNCYSCPGAAGACPLGALQNALASSGNRAPYFVLGILMLYGLTLGRTICGWLCPMGLIQEILHKLPTPKIGKNCVTRALSWLKYVILGLFVVLVPLVYAAQHLPVPAFCKYICPAGVAEGAVPLLAHPANESAFAMLNTLFARKFIIAVLILAACVFVYRAFCRFLCPLGAIYGLFARLNVVGVKVDAGKCTRCGRCTAHCGMDVRCVGDHECIHCGECVDVCAEKAITMRAGKIVLMRNEGTGQNVGKRRMRTAGWAAAIAVLLVVLIWLNGPWSAETGAGGQILHEAAQESEIPVGAEVGQRCADFTAPVYGGGEFSLEDMRGKVTVINFWATWCAPCVAELPHFQRIYEEYGGRVAMAAIHSNLVTDDVQAFLDRTEYTLPFALDETGGIIASLGGSTMLPMTVVLDGNGVIVYNQVGSVTYELLKSVIDPLLDIGTST